MYVYHNLQTVAERQACWLDLRFTHKDLKLPDTEPCHLIQGNKVICSFLDHCDTHHCEVIPSFLFLLSWVKNTVLASLGWWGTLISGSALVTYPVGGYYVGRWEADAIGGY
jgi:hypothetical protein